MATARRAPLITLGNGINIALAIVLIGAAWNLSEKLGDVRVAQADSRGDVKALTVTVDGLAKGLADLREEVRGLNDAQRK